MIFRGFSIGRFTLGLLLSWCAIQLAAAQPGAPPASAHPAAPPPSATGEIAGTVMEVRSGTPDVVVMLFDQASGMLISAKSRRPAGGKDPRELMSDLTTPLTTITGPRGEFRFDGIPAGRYRVVAQKWIGPFKGVFELQGSVIQLFGTAPNVQVPWEAAKKVVLQPSGNGVVQLGLDVGNDGTLMLLSTAPAQYDPILGFRCLGTPFLANLIGGNRMPYGRTTVIGLPPGEVHVFYFANDDSPGFAGQTVKPQIDGPLPAIRFVAGWSDGQHDPPEAIRQIMDVMEKNKLSLGELLGIKKKDKAAQELIERQPLDWKITLPDGKAYRFGDLLAADGYRRMGEYLKGRGAK